MMLAIAKVEAMTNGIANISNEINDTLGDGYMQAVQDYREAAFDAYEMVNEGYENRVAEVSVLELDISKVEASNPFKLSDDIIKQVERVGKAPVKVEPKKEVERNENALPSDIII